MGVSDWDPRCELDPWDAPEPWLPEMEWVVKGAELLLDGTTPVRVLMRDRMYMDGELSSVALVVYRGTRQREWVLLTRLVRFSDPKARPVWR